MKFQWLFIQYIRVEFTPTLKEYYPDEINDFYFSFLHNDEFIFFFFFVITIF